jgi:hypothetical protein
MVFFKNGMQLGAYLFIFDVGSLAKCRVHDLNQIGTSPNHILLNPINCFILILEVL